MTGILRTPPIVPTEVSRFDRGPASLSNREAVARQKFDAYFMQAVLEQAMPKKADAVFGRGFSGDVMRSMLAEKIAAEISKRGDLSIVGKALMRSDHTNLKPHQPAAEVVAPHAAERNGEGIRDKVD